MGDGDEMKLLRSRYCDLSHQRCRYSDDDGGKLLHPTSSRISVLHFAVQPICGRPTAPTNPISQNAILQYRMRGEA
jgi:hypothetical protein